MTRSELIEDLLHYVETTQSQLGDCPSAVVASQGDTILLERYSSGDGAKFGEVDASSLWPLCSATKGYIAALLLNLCHENILNLDDPVVLHVPEFCSAGDNRFDPGLATIRHFASHVSGVEFDISFKDQTAPDLTTARIADEPGKEFNYALPGMHVLQRVLEAASGERFPQILYDRILNPLGLRHSGYRYDLDSSVPMLPMRPPDPQQPRDAYLRANANLHPSHGTYVTALEFNRFGQFWLGDGEFEGKRYFSASLKQEALRHHSTRPSDNGPYGLLVWLFNEVDGMVISGAGSKITAIAPQTGGVVTVLRLPLEPQSDEYRFYDDKVALLRFAEKLGSA